MKYESELEQFRKEIDAMDVKIISLVASRINICRKVAIHKKRYNVPVMQPDRVNQVIARCVAIGHTVHLSNVLIKNMYQEIIDEACRVEGELIAG